MTKLHAASIWKEAKIGNIPYVTFESFCDFYDFSPPTVSGDAVTAKSLYGNVSFRANSREAFFNGRRIWLSYGFVKDDKGRMFVSRLDVIKTLDPLLRRREAAPRQKVIGVVIDAGHGGTDNGTRSKASYYEKVATLDTAKRLQAVLKSQGIPTFMTRTDDVFITLEERCELANKHKNWVFVSLHYNEAGRNAHGVETYCLSPQYTASTADGSRIRSSDREQQAGNKNDVQNVILADYVHSEIAKLHDPDGDRGLKRARFVVLRRTEIPAILVEGGFLSSPTDSRLIVGSTYRQKLAEAVARGVRNYINLMASPKERPPTVIQPTTEASAKSSGDAGDKTAAAKSNTKGGDKNSETKGAGSSSSKPAAGKATDSKTTQSATKSTENKSAGKAKADDTTDKAKGSGTTSVSSGTAKADGKPAADTKTSGSKPAADKAEQQQENKTEAKPETSSSGTSAQKNSQNSTSADKTTNVQSSRPVVVPNMQEVTRPTVDTTKERDDNADSGKATTPVSMANSGGHNWAG